MSFIFTPAKSRKPDEIYIKKASGRDKELLDRLREFLNEEEPEAVMWLVSLWGEQQAAITYKEIRETYLEGEITRQEIEKWQRDYSVFVNEKLAPKWQKAMTQGAVNQESYLSYAITPELVQQYIQNHGAELVTQLVEEQKKAIAALTARGAHLGMTADELSKTIRPCIGLILISN